MSLFLLISSTAENKASSAQTLSESSKIDIENEHLRVKFQGVTGLIDTVVNKDTGAEVKLNQEVDFLLFYICILQILYLLTILVNRLSYF